MKNDQQSKDVLRVTIEKRLELWKKMLQGDTQALLDIMLERGMATKEDFPDHFPED